MFDVAHEEEDIITEEERQAVLNPKPRTIQEVFQSIRVYVEVRSGDDDLTPGIKCVLKALGATVNDTLIKTTTHVVFKDGLNSTYNKAKKMGVPIVSVLWIEACRKMLILADTNNYKIYNLERYENPELYKRVRRPKVMTPKLDMSKPSRFAVPSVSEAKLVITVPTVDLTCETNDTITEIVEAKTETNGIVSNGEDNTVRTPVAIKTPKVDRRQTIHIATPRPNMDEMCPNVTLKAQPNIWKKAVDNIYRVAELSRSLKKEEETSKQQIFNPFPPKNEQAESDTPKVVNKRRSLYTPEPQIKLTFNKLKTLGTKPINKRRTLFTPEPSHVRPPVVKSAQRRRTLLPPTPSGRPLLATSSGKTQTLAKLFPTVSKLTASKSSPDIISTASKRKLAADSKENTPPRPKTKPFLTPSDKRLTIQHAAKMTVVPMTPELPVNKRRRTLFTPEIRTKC